MSPERCPTSNDAVCVRIPDLFSSIMSADLHVNPHYWPTVREEAYERIRKLFNKDKTWSAKNACVELGFLSATWVPTTDADGMNLMFDYNHWVFLFDDQFDEGHLKTNPVAAAEELRRMAGIMDGTVRVVDDNAHSLDLFWQDICDRIRSRASSNVYSRFLAMHHHYFDGVLLQVQDACAGFPSTHSVSSYLTFRVRTIGVFAALPVCELAEGVDLPSHVWQHPCITSLKQVTAEIVLLVNDILSFKKDQLLGVNFNIINVLLRENKGISVQQALDRIGGMLDGCYRRWYRILAEMPIWGEETDYHVQKFVGLCHAVAHGTLHWSFMTPRYFGEAQGKEVRETRRLWLPGNGTMQSSAWGCIDAVFDSDRVEMASLYADIALVGKA